MIIAYPRFSVTGVWRMDDEMDESGEWKYAGFVFSEY